MTIRKDSKKWRNPMTNEDYKAHLKALEKTCPDHKYLPLIRRGNTPYNCALLEMSLEKGQIAVSMGEYSEGDKDPDKRLTQRIKKILGRRNQLSDSLHDANTVQERALIIDKILSIQDEIKELHAKREHWRKFKELPTEKKPDDIPDNLPDLYKAQNRTRSAISYRKKKIDELAGSGNPADAEEIQAKEKEIKDLKIKLSYVNRAITEKEVGMEKV